MSIYITPQDELHVEHEGIALTCPHCRTLTHLTPIAVPDERDEAIRDLSRYVDGLVQNEHATKKLQVVINRYSSHEAVTIEQIERAVHLPIAFKIPNSYSELVRSINIGTPVSSESKSEFAQQMMKWAAGLAGGSSLTPQEPGKKRFALWK